MSIWHPLPISCSGHIVIATNREAGCAFSQLARIAVFSSLWYCISPRTACASRRSATRYLIQGGIYARWIGLIVVDFEEFRMYTRLSEIFDEQI